MDSSNAFFFDDVEKINYFNTRDDGMITLNYGDCIGNTFQIDLCKISIAFSIDVNKNNAIYRYYIQQRRAEFGQNNVP